ncbi:MAG: hypothetical protein OXR84_02525, partial [Magnetovibrio sp.]|nr:hypothetical protein [Magnetovibrio sp.]
MKPSPGAKRQPTGAAYGFDAKDVTLADMVNLAKMLPTTKHLKLSEDERLKIHKLALHNPKYAPYDAAGYARPTFSDMIFVSASKGVVLPDKRPLPGTQGIEGTPGPLLYANGELKLAGTKLGNADVSLSAAGLHGKASTGELDLKLAKILGKTAKLTGKAAFDIRIDNIEQRMA